LIKKFTSGVGCCLGIAMLEADFVTWVPNEIKIE